MDNEEKRDVHTHVHSQDEQDDYQPTKTDMKKDSVRPVFSNDCDVSFDILSQFPDDYQIVHNTIYEDEQEEDNKCHREGDSGGVSEIRCLQSVGVSEMRCLQSVGVSEIICLQSVGVSETRCLQSVGVSDMICLQSVKMEDEVQQSNDHESIEPFKYSAQISTANNGVNKFVDVKQESKLDIGVRSRSIEDKRHWIVCSGNVLKEVKAEQTLSKSVTECGEDLYEKQQQCRRRRTIYFSNDNYISTHIK